MAKSDHTTHIFILAVHLLVGLAILITYFDIKKDINEIRTVDLPELQAQLMQEL
jgi:hypothetical protein